MLLLAIAGFVAGFAFGHLPSVIKWGAPSALLIAGVVFMEINGRIPPVIINWSFLGDSSYSLYLLHVLLIDAVIFLALYLDVSPGAHVRTIGRFGMMTVCFGITAYCVVLALISYKFIERPVVRYLQNFFRQKPSPISGVAPPI